jgi:hypothetical protein
MAEGRSFSSKCRTSIYPKNRLDGVLLSALGGYSVFVVKASILLRVDWNLILTFSCFSVPALCSRGLVDQKHI